VNDTRRKTILATISLLAVLIPLAAGLGGYYVYSNHLRGNFTIVQGMTITWINANPDDKTIIEGEGLSNLNVSISNPTSKAYTDLTLILEVTSNVPFQGDGVGAGFEVMYQSPIPPHAWQIIRSHESGFVIGHSFYMPLPDMPAHSSYIANMSWYIWREPLNVPPGSYSYSLVVGQPL
jgi:hypothetical protein